MHSGTCYTATSAAKDKGIEFNFCKPLTNTSSICTGDFYAGKWGIDESGQKVCLEPLTGSVAVPTDSMIVEKIEDIDGNKIGISVYQGFSSTSEYLRINIYCNKAVDL